jgi:hypothetical protein
MPYESTPYDMRPSNDLIHSSPQHIAVDHAAALPSFDVAASGHAPWDVARTARERAYGRSGHKQIRPARMDVWRRVEVLVRAYRLGSVAVEEFANGLLAPFGRAGVGAIECDGRQAVLVEM